LSRQVQVTVAWLRFGSDRGRPGRTVADYGRGATD